MSPEAMPTVWGLTPVQLHDRFWAARGVQVVRCGDLDTSIEIAELYLLTEPSRLVMFKLRELVDLLSWVKPRVLMVRLESTRQQGYSERAVAGEDGRFQTFERRYPARQTLCSYVALTPDRRIAQIWRDEMGDEPSPRRALCRRVGRTGYVTGGARGRSYRSDRNDQLMKLVRDLVELWEQPDATIGHLERDRPSLWRHDSANVPDDMRLIGSAWVGAGREIPGGACVVGPAVLWDSPEHRPEPPSLTIDEVEPSQPFARRVKPVKLRARSRLSRWSKRLFDIGFALAAIAITLPFYPLIMLAIWIEDGWPVFFAHRRETMGGREFPCVKFRTMYKDSEKLREAVAALNQADGPQVNVDPDKDPRVTKVGRLLRKLQVDEFPQFFNVLLGQMSVVGPRPSPRKENQYCPAWREARLSVRPGITGLWQVCRTRQADLDFQEWIRYDLEYVQANSWRLDAWIIGQTVLLLIPGLRRS